MPSDDNQDDDDYDRNDDNLDDQDSQTSGVYDLDRYKVIQINNLLTETL